MELNGYRQRQFRKKYTYRIGMWVGRMIVAALTFAGSIIAVTTGFLVLPALVLASVLRKHKVIGIVLVTGFANTTPLIV